MRKIILLSLAALSACTPARLLRNVPTGASYHLIAAPTATLLEPPSGSAPTIPLRRSERRNPACRITNPILSTTLNGSLLTFRYASPIPLTENNTARSLYNDIEQLRAQLQSTSLASCLPPREANSILAALPQQLTLPPRLSHLLLFGAYPVTGYVDLLPGHFLEWASILPEPAHPTLASTTSLLRINQSPSGALALSALTTEEIEKKGQRFRRRPSVPNALAPVAPLPFLRLYLLTRQMKHQHGVILASATSYKAFQTLDQILAADQPINCATLAPSLTCVHLSRDQILNFRLRILLDGQPRFVPLDATVRTVLGKTAAPNLRVSRPYLGKLIPVIPSAPNQLLDLNLIGNESITTQ